MSIEPRQITVGGLRVEVVRKPIKNLHLGVYPPNGRVRVAAPMTVSDDAVRLAVVTRMGWIQRQRARFEGQSRQSERRFVSGETHFFQGRRYRLAVVEGARSWSVVIRNSRTLTFHVRSAEARDRERAFQAWYRRELKARAAPIVARWAAKLGLAEPAWGVKRMKTKWGACNVSGRRIWLNLELIKKPPQCLVYVIVHEMMHLLERNHTDRFVALMDKAVPDWRTLRSELNAEPLAHEAWDY